MKTTAPGTILLLVGFLLIGCDRPEIRAYRVARDHQHDSTGAPVATRTEAGPPIEWDVPAGWVQDPTERQFRFATFSSGDGVEIAISFIAGDAGGLLANVNRWRGQVGLDPIAESELGGALEFVDGSHTSFRVLDVTGTQRLLTAIVNPGDSNTWFVKSTASEEQVDSVRQELLDFAGSFRATASASGGSSSQASLPTINSTAPPIDFGEWAPPHGWMEDTNASSIVAAAWTTESGARITVTPLAGDGGGLHQNIDMWRSQLDLEHSADDAAYHAQFENDGYAYFDEQSPDSANRIAGWIVPRNGQTIFLKAIGSPESISQEMEHLVSLLETIVGMGEAN